jgi:Putative auto-transporter adhesin, head GIN domain
MRPFLAVFAVVALSGCGAAKSDAAPNIVTRTFPATGFDRVALAGSENVRVVQGKEFLVSATGPERVVDDLDIKVSGNFLKIGRKPALIRLSWAHATKPTVITVTMPVIREASLAGSGDFNVDAVAPDAFEGGISGSGNLTVSGVSQSVKLGIAGSGNIYATTLSAVQLEASIAGSGNVKARATGKADLSIAGSGNIDVSGTKNCAISKAGSGDVRCTG